MAFRMVVSLLVLLVIGMVKHGLTDHDRVAKRYARSGDAKIYYEVYGKGPALVLLHSDFYGYIDDFSEYIPDLAKHFRVIAIGKRGHGKSELGQAPFTEALFAKDVLAVLRHEKLERAAVLGFGGGATTAYYLAAYHPGHVEKVVGLAGVLSSEDYRKGVKEDLSRLTFEQIDANAHLLMMQRRRLMPQPQRLEELLDRMKAYWVSDTFVDAAKMGEISCPVLVVTGDRDYYQGIGVAIGIQKAIPGARLKLVPACDRTALTLRPELLKTTIIPFLNQ